MDDIPISILLMILAGLLLLSAFFSGSETALMTLNRYRLKHLVESDHKSAKLAHNLLQRPDRLLGLILLGNNFVNILASSLATVIAIRVAGQNAITLAALLLTFIVLIFAEVAPKTFAAFHPERLAFPAAWVFTPLLRILYPFVWLINTLSNQLLKLLGVNPNKRASTNLNTQELKTVVSDTNTVLPERYRKLLIRILDMESATVEDIMEPRSDIIGLDLEDDISILNQHIRTSKYSRLPVYNKHIDRVIGLLDVRRAINKLMDSTLTKKDIIELLDKPYFIPEGTALHTQLADFRRQQIKMGFVVDEYGNTLGLVTVEALLQEIVDDITDDATDINRQQDGSWIIDAGITIRELNRLLGTLLPVEGPKTLNGLIMEVMETIPRPGTSLKIQDLPIEIVESTEYAIKRVRIIDLPSL
ncbi:MAG: CNNM domain-containing protein [Gammaproteobacteria bacterium]|nr:CNNM domain-containing protein [Gammaproteobacteria bacterium]